MNDPLFKSIHFITSELKKIPWIPISCSKMKKKLCWHFLVQFLLRLYVYTSLSAIWPSKRDHSCETDLASPFGFNFKKDVQLKKVEFHSQSLTVWYGMQVMKYWTINPVQGYLSCLTIKSHLTYLTSTLTFLVKFRRQSYKRNLVKISPKFLAVALSKLRIYYILIVTLIEGKK